MNEVEQLTVNTLRFLSVEAIQKANSGHPGLPLGAAPAAYALWAKEMKHSPQNPDWADRDRFILSAGHGSSLLYSLLHIFSYGISVEELKRFRQWGSKTPGHPEYRKTPGVETTTGPLGQGIANAVGMALAETYLAAQFNRPGYPIVDHYTYALCGDGCLMEGVSAEAASLAGTLSLGKLILLYDSNHITIEGDTDASFREDVCERFHAYGFQTLVVEDGNDVDQIAAAIAEAKKDKQHPTLIRIETKIGFGSPHKEGLASAHGEPLGEEELKETKKKMGWPYLEEFFVPEEVKKHLSQVSAELEAKYAAWNALWADYQIKYPEEAKQWKQWQAGELPNLDQDKRFWSLSGEGATRGFSGNVIQYLADAIPNLIGGSADLAPSNKSEMKKRQYYSPANRTGSNIHFGIREFAMTAIASGMFLHGGLRPYIAGFFVFSDYMKAGLRMQAIMKLPIISVFTHDSIGVGEDGPTHQPIEQLAALRSMPNFVVFRPCDGIETAAGWYCALQRKDGPTALVLSRQTLPELIGTGKNARKGGYVIKESKKEVPELILIASGSEVALILQASDQLSQKGIDTRVVSMPSMELFEEQSDEYKASVLPKNCRTRMAVEAGSSFGWHKYVGLDGSVLSLDHFGASAPAEELFEQYGFTVSQVVDEALKLVEN